MSLFSFTTPISRTSPKQKLQHEETQAKNKGFLGFLEQGVQKTHQQDVTANKKSSKKEFMKHNNKTSATNKTTRTSVLKDTKEDKAANKCAKEYTKNAKE